MNSVSATMATSWSDRANVLHIWTCIPLLEGCIFSLCWFANCEPLQHVVEDNPIILCAVELQHRCSGLTMVVAAPPLDIDISHNRLNRLKSHQRRYTSVSSGSSIIFFVRDGFLEISKLKGCNQGIRQGFGQSNSLFGITKSGQSSYTCV